MTPLFDRFNAKVDRRGPDDCWAWTGHISGIHTAGAGSPLIKPRRIAWMQAYGSIPPDAVSQRYSCTVTTCCNPAHLTHGADVRLPNRCVGHQGWPNGMTKLTEDNVRTIRSRVAAGERQGKVGADFGITQSNVSNICGGHTWRHIP